MIKNINELFSNTNLKTAEDEGIDATSLAGKIVILYFYPKDNTPACTREALLFRDHLDELTDLGAIVIGISRDPVKAHDKFSKSNNLNFPLLSDPEEEACRMFEVLKEKNLYGRKSIGIERSTFVFDRSGELVREFRKVKVDAHLDELLAFLPQIH